MMTIKSLAIIICLLLSSTLEAHIFVCTAMAQQQSNNSSRDDSMGKTAAITLCGLLDKRITVGYRSPYVLITGDNTEFEIRESGSLGSDQLEKHIGNKVELTGRQVTIPSGKAPAGSEAASRFIGGIIPELKYIEAVSVEKR